MPSVSVKEPAYADSHTIAYPSGTAAGDMLVWFVAMHDTPHKVNFKHGVYSVGGVTGFGSDLGVQMAVQIVGTETPSQRLSYQFSNTDTRATGAAPMIFLMRLLASEFDGGGPYGFPNFNGSNGFSQATNDANPGPATVSFENIRTANGASVDANFFGFTFFETGYIVKTIPVPTGWTQLASYTATLGSKGEKLVLWQRRSTTTSRSIADISVDMRSSAVYPAGLYHIRNHVISIGFSAKVHA